MKARLNWLTTVALLASLAGFACAGGEERASSETAASRGEAMSEEHAAAHEEGEEPEEEGETEEATVIDQALADRGEQLMKERGCNACHKLGEGRLVGPDLAGVTKRRSQEFIIAMIVNPDSMLINDQAAKQMLAEYFTPMTNQGVTREDARALLEYLRRYDADQDVD